MYCQTQANKELEFLLKAQRHKLMQDFSGNVEVLGEVLGYYKRNNSPVIFENALRKLTLKLNNTSLLYNTLYFEAQDDKKNTKDLHEDLKETCLLFYNALLQIKTSFENKELKKPFQFYLELLKNPLKEDPKKLSVGVKSKKPMSIEKDQSFINVLEQKLNNFLSTYTKADLDFQQSLKKIADEGLQTKYEIQNTISSTINQMNQNHAYMPENDLVGYWNEISLLFKDGKDVFVKEKLSHLTQWTENYSINPQHCSFLLEGLKNLGNLYAQEEFYEMAAICQKMHKTIDNYRKKL